MLKSGNYTSYAPAAIADIGGATANLFDLLRYAKGEVNKWEDMSADYFVFNPADLTMLQGLKDANGNYLLGGPGTLAGDMIWGVRCVTNANITKGNFLVFDSENTCQSYTRQGYVMEITNSHADTFIKNVKTMKITTRKLMTVYAPRGIVYGALSLPKA